MSAERLLERINKLHSRIELIKLAVEGLHAGDEDIFVLNSLDELKDELDRLLDAKECAA